MNFFKLLPLLLLACAPFAQGAPVYKWKEEGAFFSCHQVMGPEFGADTTLLVSNDKCRKPATMFRVQDFGGVSHCVEIDSESGGQRFRLEAPMDKCNKGETGKRWEFVGLLSECWEYDTLTLGKRFHAKATGCVKPSTRFEERQGVLEYGCFEVDSLTGGKQFTVEAPLTKCPNGLNPNFWVEQKPSPAVVQETQINHSNVRKNNMQRFREWLSGDEAGKNQDAR